jgi:hypothetical protein
MELSFHEPPIIPAGFATLVIKFCKRLQTVSFPRPWREDWAVFPSSYRPSLVFFPQRSASAALMCIVLVTFFFEKKEKTVARNVFVSHHATFQCTPVSQ